MQTESCTSSQDTRLQGQTESCQGEEEEKEERGEKGEEEDVAKQKRLSAASVKMKAWLSGVERKNPVSLVSLEVNI